LNPSKTTKAGSSGSSDRSLLFSLMSGSSTQLVFHWPSELTALFAAAIDAGGRLLDKGGRFG